MGLAHKVESVRGRCAIVLVLRPERWSVDRTSALAFLTISLSRLFGIVNTPRLLAIKVFGLDFAHHFDKG